MNRIREFLRWPGGYDMTLRDWVDCGLVVSFVIWAACAVSRCAP